LAFLSSLDDYTLKVIKLISNEWKPDKLLSTIIVAFLSIFVISCPYVYLTSHEWDSNEWQNENSEK